jgi:hypothetical protein
MMYERSTEPQAGQISESPDDWVVQDRVPIRQCDRGWWAFDGKPCPSPDDMWHDGNGHGGTLRYAVQCGYRHGQKSALQNAVLHVMCRRRDLPEQIKHVPMQSAGTMKVSYHQTGEGVPVSRVDEQTPAPAKPPIGIMPRRLWLEERRDALRDAITRYEAVVGEWRIEEALIEKELQPAAPKRTTARLFRSHIDGVVIAEYTDPGDDWQEIKVDPQTGQFYVDQD